MSLIILLVAIFIALTIIGWIFRLVRASLSTAILIAVILIVMKVVFGVDPGQVLDPVIRWFDSLWRWLTSGRWSSASGILHDVNLLTQKLQAAWNVISSGW